MTSGKTPGIKDLTPALPELDALNPQQAKSIVDRFLELYATTCKEKNSHFTEHYSGNVLADVLKTAKDQDLQATVYHLLNAIMWRSEGIQYPEEIGKYDHILKKAPTRLVDLSATSKDAQLLETAIRDVLAKSPLHQLHKSSNSSHLQRIIEDFSFKGSFPSLEDATQDQAKTIISTFKAIYDKNWDFHDLEEHNSWELHPLEVILQQLYLRSQNKNLVAGGEEILRIAQATIDHYHSTEAYDHEMADALRYAIVKGMPPKDKEREREEYPAH